MNSHINKKSILFYLIAITSTVLIFIFIVGIGERLQAPEKKPSFEKINPYGHTENDNRDGKQKNSDRTLHNQETNNQNLSPINFKLWHD